MNAIAASTEFDRSALYMAQWLEAKFEVATQFISEIPEMVHDHAARSYERAHEYLAWLRTRQILEHEQGQDNLRVARGGKAMSLVDQPIRPEPQSVGGRLLKLFTRASAPAPEKS